MKKLLLLSLIAMITFTSCKLVKTSDYNKLVKENSIMAESIFRSDSIQNCFMTAYAEIERNLEEIKAREKMINTEAVGAENNMDQQQKILNDIAEIGKLLESNRKNLGKMQSLRKQLIAAKKEAARLKEENDILKNSAFDSERPIQQVVVSGSESEEIAYYKQENQRLAELNASLEQTIANLRDRVAESEARIESLQEELALLKDAYAALQAINDSLQIEIARVKGDDNYFADDDIDNVAYFVMGNSKDLKAKKVLDKKGHLNHAINESAFIEISNIHDRRVIETKSSKATIMSDHPNSSYTINKRDSKNIKIEIKNPEKFWEMSRHLVIVTK